MIIRLNGSTSGYTEIDAPAVAGSNTLVLPTGNGSSGQVLSTNGSGALSWIGAGKILQVVQTTKTDAFSQNGGQTWTDWTGMSATITPSSASNKILITLTSGCSNNTGDNFQFVKLLRGSTDIALGDTAGSATRCWIDASSQNAGTGSVYQKPLVGTFLDSPNTTSATTYKLQVWVKNSQIAYFGRTALIDDAFRSAIPSTLTLLEVAA